jgi:UDP-N-acetylglucosamine 2-epimerase
MKKIMLVFGTRPEAIKMAPLVKEFQKYPESFQTIVCVTGQHREMLDQVLQIFDIQPDYDLNIMKQGQDLYDVTARVLVGMRDVLKETQPDVVLVHGDTTTSMAAALAAFYQQIPVGHVEAGLRTGNIYSPWPEEMNRQMTGRIATYNFAPTPLSRQNLLKENVAEEKITVTGNTVIDALYMVVDKIKNDTKLDAELEEILKQSGYDVNRCKTPQATRDPRPAISDKRPAISDPRKLVLITGHRRENFGDGFINMCTAIKDLTQKYPDVDFVYPMHLNPNVRKPISEIFGEEVMNRHKHSDDPNFQLSTFNFQLSNFTNLFFIEPLEYLSFVYLMEKSYLVLTDSGGIQEEAPGLGKPVLVMRDTTERPEALDAGTVKLVGTDYAKIVAEVSKLIDDQEYYEKMSKAVNPYGDGKACGRIVNKLR